MAIQSRPVRAAAALGAALALSLLPVAAGDSAAPAPRDAAQRARVVINVPSRTLTLYLGGRAHKTYPVGVGRPQWPTPLGQWRILQKVVNPVWGYPLDFDPGGRKGVTPPGPRNPLGTRWMGFTPEEHGIHGTNQPQSVGKVISHGCVRMHVPDSEELFDLVQVGTPVEVRHDTVLVKIDHARGYVLAAGYPDVYGRGGPTRAAVQEALRRQRVTAKLSDERLRKLRARRDGVFRVVGWLVFPQ